jgi:Ras family
MYRSISRLYYRGANACILCYSITDTTSFDEMGVWLTELRRNLPPDIILHVVGTKADLVAKDPSIRQVPFERCIAYVADNLAPGMSSTPPATATPAGSGGALEGGGGSAFRGFLGQGSGPAAALDGARSPSSKRSSGFWGQEVGWDCCHEVSAESGEGVEEVFRVITRKLVEQNRKIQEQLMNATQSPSPGEQGGGDYFDRMRPGGSFRVGRDRRSWFGVPVETYIEEASPDGQPPQVKTRRKCC